MSISLKISFEYRIVFVVIMSISKYKLYTAVIKCIYRYVDYVVVVDLQYYCSYLKYFGFKTCIFNFSLIIIIFFLKHRQTKKHRFTGHLTLPTQPLHNTNYQKKNYNNNNNNKDNNNGKKEDSDPNQYNGINSEVGT